MRLIITSILALAAFHSIPANPSAVVQIKLSDVCGKGPDDFPPPPGVPHCEDDHHIDYDCFTACRTTYKDNMVNISAQACDQLTQAIDEAEQDIDDAQLAFNLCEDEIEDCLDAYFAEVFRIFLHFRETRRNISTQYNIARAVAVEAYGACIDTCCEPD